MPAPAPWKVTKMAQFLDLATERRGSLASIPFDAVAGFNPDLALLAGPYPGTDFVHAFSLHPRWSASPSPLVAAQAIDPGRTGPV